MRKPRKAVQVIAIATCATAVGGAGLASALSHESSGAAGKVANVAPAAAKASTAAKESAARKPTRTAGSKMMKNKGTGKCLVAVRGDLKLAKCNRRDGRQYLGQWSSKMYFPEVGCVSANKRTWDVRVEDCSVYPNHGYTFNWALLWEVRSYNTIANTEGCYLEGGNKGNFVRCSPGFKGDNKKWQWGLWG
ncbi:hypothetical protein [Actinomadura roseirufa]|uniref:hypothetical protein n=1 Tax=Actinomadura roseirufa TaxID=2094049 RepID=UPI001040F418|nr:hypothetical protein [Actinomadura roseirufa]